MRYTQHLKIDALSATDLAESLLEVEKQAAENFSTMENGDVLIAQVMSLFHQAFLIDNKIFVNEMFFESQRAIRATQQHQLYIFAQWDRLKTNVGGQFYQVELVNLYRSIVSDMFDPYLSIVVGCLKMIDGNFKSFLEANLSSAEFSKFQYASKKLSETKLLSGYFPIIRNAVSHAGTDSIDYLPEGIVFKKIVRGSEPNIKDYLRLTEVELVAHIQSLIDFTTAIDVSMNIFGLDISGFIKEQRDVSFQFAEKLASVEAFELWRKNCDDFYLPIWSDHNLDEKAKQEYFAMVFAQECNNRGLPAKQLVFKENRLLLIEVPARNIDLHDHHQLVERIVELIRYCLLAEPLFYPRVESFIVDELTEEGKDSYQVWLKASDLRHYNIRKANIYDLLHDGNFYRNKINLNINVDFEKLKELNIKSFDVVRKGRHRG